MDKAGYQNDLLGFCDLGHSERFERIEFAVGYPVEDTFKNAVAEVEESAWRVALIVADEADSIFVS